MLCNRHVASLFRVQAINDVQHLADIVDAVIRAAVPHLFLVVVSAHARNAHGMRTKPRADICHAVTHHHAFLGRHACVFGAGKDAQTWDSADLWGVLPETAAVVKGENLFPRVDAAKALEELEIAEAEARKAALPAVETEPQLTEKVDFDTFCKSDFRVVKVKACEAVKKSEKLLRFTLDDGTGTDRQILSGIHKFYEPEELVGKTLAAIVNLPPRKMMGLESNGMLLSAVHTEKGEEKLNLIMLDDSIPAGAKLC